MHENIIIKKDFSMYNFCINKVGTIQLFIQNEGSRSLFSTLKYYSHAVVIIEYTSTEHHPVLQIKRYGTFRMMAGKNILLFILCIELSELKIRRSSQPIFEM